MEKNGALVLDWVVGLRLGDHARNEVVAELLENRVLAARVREEAVGA